MTYKTKICPHCYKNIMVFRSDYNRYGSPVRQCEFCHKFFVDKDYHEIECEGLALGDKLHLKLHFSPLWLFHLCFLGIPMLAVGLLWGSEYSTLLLWSGIIISSLLIYSIINDIVKYPEYKEGIGLEERKSRERLSQPEYATILKNMGLYVPQKYLISPDKNHNE